MDEEALIALVRTKAEEAGFFRACLGRETADAMANGQMNDEATLEVAFATAAAIRELS